MADNAIAFVNGEASGNPPPTDDFFPDRAILRVNLLDALRLGIAIGVAFAVIFVLMTLITAIAGGAGTVMDFFELLYPGLAPGLFAGVIIGFALSFVYGFIFGAILGVAYNTLIRGFALKNESVERYT